MKVIPLTLLSIILFTGCVSDPLARFYQPYSGEQQKWPVASGTFSNTRDEIIFYHGLPDKPYTVIGRYDRANLPPAKLAASAKANGANAVCLAEQEINTMQTDPGMVLFGSGVAVPLPGNSHAVSSTIAHAYLIHVEGVAKNPESVKSSSAKTDGKP
jgi:hypothetical protein